MAVSSRPGKQRWPWGRAIAMWLCKRRWPWFKIGGAVAVRGVEMAVTSFEIREDQGMAGWYEEEWPRYWQWGQRVGVAEIRDGQGRDGQGWAGMGSAGIGRDGQGWAGMDREGQVAGSEGRWWRAGAGGLGWGDPFDSKTYITYFLKLDYRVISPLSVNNQ